MPERADAIVVGAGVVGLFTALELAARGLQPGVLEALPGPGLGVTSASANVIHVAQPPFRGLRFETALEGNRAYRRLRGLLGFRMLEARAVLAARGPHARLLAWLAWRLLRSRLPPWASPRLAGWRTLSEVEPAISDGVGWGVVLDGYAVVDPLEVAAALARELESRGGWVEYNTRVEAAGCRGPVRVEAGGSEYRASVLVNAAGLGAGRVAGLCGHSAPAVRPIRGVMTLHSRPRVRAILAWIPARPRAETKGGGVIPQLDGSTLLGPTYPGAAPEGGEAGALASRFQGLLAEGLPPPSRVVSGYRPAAGDREFHVYAREAAVHLVGIESPGLTAAPALARIAAEKAARIAGGAK